MDERFFDDKNRNGQLSGREKYTEADYFDENFSLNFKRVQGNAQSFNKDGRRESIDDESFTSFARNMDAEDIDGLFSDGHGYGAAKGGPAPALRTPHGVPASQRGVPSRDPARNTAAAHSGRAGYNTMAGDPMRVP